MIFKRKLYINVTAASFGIQEHVHMARVYRTASGAHSCATCAATATIE